MKSVRKILPAASAALCVAILLLLLADCVQPGLSLFLKPAVKWLLLVACVVVIAASAARLADQRRRLRRRLARKGKREKKTVSG